METKIILPIIERLKVLRPFKIILFGSYAYGQPRNDSDIDLLVVTNDEFIPQNFSQKNRLYLKVSDVITDFEKKLPVDLIVYTKPMYEKFVGLGSMFSKTILKKGLVLYENIN